MSGAALTGGCKRRKRKKTPPTPTRGIEPDIPSPEHEDDDGPDDRPQPTRGIRPDIPSPTKGIRPDVPELKEDDDAPRVIAGLEAAPPPKKDE